MAHMLQLGRLKELLEASHHNLHVELDLHHAAMRQSIDNAFSLQTMKKQLERQLENQQIVVQQQQQRVERLPEMQQQPGQQKSLQQQKQEEEQPQSHSKTFRPAAGNDSAAGPQRPCFPCLSQLVGPLPWTAFAQPAQPELFSQCQSEPRPPAVNSQETINSKPAAKTTQMSCCHKSEKPLSFDDDRNYETSAKSSKAASNATATLSLKYEKYDKSKRMKQKMTQMKGLIQRKGAHMMDTPMRKRIGWWMDTVFDRVLGILVAVNLVVVFCYLQHQGQEADKSLGFESHPWKHAEIIFALVDIFFSVVFTAEIVLRLYVEGLAYFKSCFNIIDTVIVPTMMLNIFMKDIGPSLAFVRSIRVLRIVCAFRVVRTVSHFQHLRILWNTIVGSVASFMHSMAIMLICMLMFAILLTQSLHEFILDSANDLSTRHMANRYFGNGFKSLWTVFEFTFSGCWPGYARPLVEEVHWLYALLFALYVTTVIFAMTRVISALFLKETISKAAEDTEMMVWERDKSTRNMERDLVALFQIADTNGDGLLTEQEFESLLSNEKIKLWLGMLGVDGSDAHRLYHALVGDHVGGLPCESFLYGVKRVKGEARAQDLIPLVNDCKQILRLCEQTMNSLSQLQGFQVRAEGILS